MFNDRQKALEALEAELLREEEEELLEEQEELEDEEEPLYRNFSNNYGDITAYNRDVEDGDLEDYVETVRDGGRSGRVKALAALLLILVAGIFLLLALLLMRYR